MRAEVPLDQCRHLSAAQAREPDGDRDRHRRKRRDHQHPSVTQAWLAPDRDRPVAESQAATGSANLRAAASSRTRRSSAAPRSRAVVPRPLMTDHIASMPLPTRDLGRISGFLPSIGSSGPSRSGSPACARSCGCPAGSWRMPVRMRDDQHRRRPADPRESLSGAFHAAAHRLPRIERMDLDRSRPPRPGPAPLLAWMPADPRPPAGTRPVGRSTARAIQPLKASLKPPTDHDHLAGSQYPHRSSCAHDRRPIRHRSFRTVG